MPDSLTWIMVPKPASGLVHVVDEQGRSCPVSRKLLEANFPQLGGQILELLEEVPTVLQA